MDSCAKRIVFICFACISTIGAYLFWKETMWTAFYQATKKDDDADPTKHGFMTQEEAWEYAESQYCHDCRNSTMNSPSCSYDWAIMLTSEWDRMTGYIPGDEIEGGPIDLRLMVEPTMIADVQNPDEDNDEGQISGGTLGLEGFAPSTLSPAVIDKWIKYFESTPINEEEWDE